MTSGNKQSTVWLFATDKRKVKNITVARNYEKVGERTTTRPSHAFSLLYVSEDELKLRVAALNCILRHLELQYCPKASHGGRVIAQ